MVSMILMFIGGSPMGTAGGVKTTTVAILLVVVASYIRGDSDTVVWDGRSWKKTSAPRSYFFFALTMAFTATVLLISVTGSPLLDCLYEIVSAVATVGLTRSLTPTLPAAGKIIVILVMFMGRLGPVTLAIALRRRSGRKRCGYPSAPEQRVLIG